MLISAGRCASTVACIDTSARTCERASFSRLRPSIRRRHVARAGPTQHNLLALAGAVDRRAAQAAPAAQQKRASRATVRRLVQQPWPARGARRAQRQEDSVRRERLGDGSLLDADQVRPGAVASDSSHQGHLGAPPLQAGAPHAEPRCTAAGRHVSAWFHAAGQLRKLLGHVSPWFHAAGQLRKLLEGRSAGCVGR